MNKITRIFYLDNIVKTLAMGETKIMERVKMIKTLAPKEIPNGSIGTVKCQCSIKKNGLHYVEFDCGWAAYVYGHEVEKI